jgi:hypothetical protein
MNNGKFSAEQKIKIMHLVGWIGDSQPNNQSIQPPLIVGMVRHTAVSNAQGRVAAVAIHGF